MRNEIVVIAGFSGAGKDTVASWLVGIGYKFVTSHTTRPMRDGESMGKPYFFVDDETMSGFVARDELIELRTYNTIHKGQKTTWRYAVHEHEVRENTPHVVVLDLLGVEEFRAYFGDRLRVIFLEADKKTRLNRAMARDMTNFNPHEWLRRLEDDTSRFSKEYIDQTCDIVIENNDNFSTCMCEVVEFIS